MSRGKCSDLLCHYRVMFGCGVGEGWTRNQAAGGDSGLLMLLPQGLHHSCLCCVGRFFGVVMRGVLLIAACMFQSMLMPTERIDGKKQSIIFFLFREEAVKLLSGGNCSDLLCHYRAMFGYRVGKGWKRNQVACGH